MSNNNSNALVELIDAGIRDNYTRCSFKQNPDKTKMVAKAWSKSDGYDFVTVSGQEKKYDHMLFATISMVNGLPAVGVRFDENFTKASAKQKDQAWARMREQIESGSLNLFVDDIETKYCK